MTASRFALFFVPAADSPLYQFGQSVLGYDCYSRTETMFPSDLPLTNAGWMDLTSQPRRYGFHATLKAPFHLKPDTSAEKIAEKFRAYAASVTTSPEIDVSLGLLDDFIAIMPRKPSPPLNQLAGQCVAAFDSFRAPLGQEERGRRMQTRLSLREAGNLERWGYPYVFEDFRFHMTLTGPIDAADREIVLDYLRSLFHDAHGIRPIRIDRLCLVRQDWPSARFHVIEQAGLGKA